MDKELSFEQFLAQNVGQTVDLYQLCLSLFLSAVSAGILSLIYSKMGTAVNNRGHFARTFMLLTITTAFIILIVKSSLALSLGLVGALSIVRFRAAIKEPEELCYLFICIGMGLGYGAGRITETLFAFSFVLAAILCRRWIYKNAPLDGAMLTVTGQMTTERIEEIISSCKNISSETNLVRADLAEDTSEAFISLPNYDQRDTTELLANLKEIAGEKAVISLVTKAI